MSAVSRVSIGARTVSLHAFTGEVTSAVASSETAVTRDRHNRQVSARTWHHNEIVVRSADGEVRALDTGNAKLAVTGGQTVTMLWGIVGRADKGDYVAFHNHSTGRTGYFAKGVNDVAGPPLYNVMLIGLVFLVVANVPGTFRGDAGAILLVATGLGTFWWLLQRRKKLRAAVEAALATIR